MMRRTDNPITSAHRYRATGPPLWPSIFPSKFWVPYRRNPLYAYQAQESPGHLLLVLLQPGRQLFRVHVAATRAGQLLI